MVVQQIQWVLDEVHYFDPFYSGFRPRYWTETALVILFDDLWQKQDACILHVLDLSKAFNTIHHDILLDWLGIVSGWPSIQLVLLFS